MTTHLGLKIQQIRDIKKLDQTYVAKQLGISQSSYSDIESGKTKITDAKLLQIAKALDVGPEVIKQFNETVAFHSCTQSGYINTNHINPLDKITELYDKLLEEKEKAITSQKELIMVLKTTIELMKNK